MFYRATIYNEPKLKFAVEKVSDDEACGQTSGYYCVLGVGYSGDYVIRKTKKSAISALKEHIDYAIKEK